MLSDSGYSELIDGVEILDIFKAVKQNDLDNVGLMIKLKMNINDKDRHGNTPLQLAIKNHCVEIVAKLLDNNVQLNVSDENGDLGLHIAAKYGYIGICDLLLNREADISIQNRDGNTALHLAIQLNRVNVVKSMLKRRGRNTKYFVFDGVDKCLTLKNIEDVSPIAMIEEKYSIKPEIWKDIFHIIKETQANVPATPKKPPKRRPSVYQKTLKTKDSPEISETDEPPAKKVKLPDNWDGTHNTGGLRTSFHGVLFQVKLLMLFLKAAVNKKCDFNLGSEVDAAGKFDDLVIRYRTKEKKGIEWPRDSEMQRQCSDNQSNNLGQGENLDQNQGQGQDQKENTSEVETKTDSKSNWCYRLIQAKHTLEPDKKRITVNSLTTISDDNFSLQKYYSSFCKILEADLFKSDENYIDHLKDIVIITNTDFDFDIDNSEIANSVAKRKKQSVKDEWKRYFSRNALSIDDEFLFIKNEATIKQGSSGERDSSSEQDTAIKINKFKPEFFEEVKTKIKAVIEKKQKMGKKGEKGKKTQDTKEIYDDRKMTVFLQKLVFITGYHNEKALDNAIGETFPYCDGDFMENALQNEIINFLKQYDNGRAKFISHVKGNEIFKRLTERMKIFTCTVLTEIYLRKLEAYRISFSDSTLMEFGNEIENHLKNDKIHVANVVSKSSLLSAIKMCQTLKSDALIKRFDYLKRRSFIFLGAEELNEGKMTEHIKLAFGSNEGHRILVICCDFMAIEECKNLLNSFSSFASEGKKIILIVSSQNLYDLSMAIPITSSTNPSSSRPSLPSPSTHSVSLDYAIPSTSFAIPSTSYATPSTSSSLTFASTSFCQPSTPFLHSSTSLSSTIVPSIAPITKITDEKIDFVDLTTTTQLNLLRKQVFFQGKPLKLNQLINIKVAEKLIDSASLSELIAESSISIGNEEPFISYGYEKNYYIGRNLSFEMLNTKIFSQKFDDVIFFVTNFNPEEARRVIARNKIYPWEERMFHRNGVILPPTKPTGESDQELFDELCRNHSNTTIHWLEYRVVKSQMGRSEHDEKCVFWRGFRGRSDVINGFELRGDTSKKKFNRNHLTEEQMIALEQRFIVIANDSGFGKSTLLTSLAEKLRNRRKSNALWVVRIDLNEHSEKKKKLSLNKFEFTGDDFGENLKNAQKFIVSIAVKNERKIFERQLFEKCVMHFDDVDNGIYPKVVILFDGFDEITPFYREKTTSLMKLLSETNIQHFFITTRTNEKDYLQNELKTPAYVLTTFSEPNQKDFLVKFWNFNRSTSAHSTNETPSEINFDGHAQDLVEMAKTRHGGDEYYSLTEIPLTLKLLAERVQNNKFEFSSGNMLGVQLYEGVIKDKFNRYDNEKAKSVRGNQASDTINDSNLYRLKAVHQELAFEHIFPNRNLREYSIEFIRFKEDCLKQNRHIGQELIRVGLIRNDKFDFIHRAFAEYFVCEYWVEHFGQVEETEKSKLIEEALKPDLVNKKQFNLYGHIRQLLKSQLENQANESNKFIKFQNILQKLIEKYSNCSRIQDKNEATSYAEKQFNRFFKDPKNFYLKFCTNANDALNSKRCRHV